MKDVESGGGWPAVGDACILDVHGGSAYAGLDEERGPAVLAAAGHFDGYTSYFCLHSRRTFLPQFLLVVLMYHCSWLKLSSLPPQESRLILCLPPFYFGAQSSSVGVFSAYICTDTHLLLSKEAP